tara:strand:- start:2359 stop:2607 length:249 start_codon:yes stop_codon:yes gene_type:complete
MNYSKWVEQFELALDKQYRSNNKEVQEAYMQMACWAQNACPDGEPNAEECRRIYGSVMSSLDEQGLGDKPFYKDVYNIAFTI